MASLRDTTATLAAADPADKAAVYEEMGIEVTYHQNGRVLVESRPRHHLPGSTRSRRELARSRLVVTV